MSNQFLGQFSITAPDLALTFGPGGMIGDMDDLASETISEIQNLQQDLGNRLVEMPGSNLDFGSPNSRGVGIMMYLNASYAKVAGLPSRIDAEFIQDPRVVGSQTTLATQADGSILISSLVETVAGVFGLTWSWSNQGLYPVMKT